METKIKGIETKDERYFRLTIAAITGQDSLQNEAEIAVKEDWECIRSWFKHHQIDETKSIENQLLELCIAMGRELYPKKSLSGRPKVWTNDFKGVLVVELEQMMLKNPSLSVDQATEKLAKTKPWSSIIKSNLSRGDPSKVIRQLYYKSKNVERTQLVRDTYEKLQKIGGKHIWEKTVFLLEEMSEKKYASDLITTFFDSFLSKKI